MWQSCVLHKSSEIIRRVLSGRLGWKGIGAWIWQGKLRRSSIEMEAVTLDNIYKIMQNFGKLYDIISDEEKPLKSIEFNCSNTLE